MGVDENVCKEPCTLGLPIRSFVRSIGVRHIWGSRVAESREPGVESTKMRSGITYIHPVNLHPVAQQMSTRVRANGCLDGRVIDGGL